LADAIDSIQDLSEHIPRGLILQITNFVVSSAIGIWLTPFLIHTLGVAAYGLVPLAISLTGFMAVVMQSFGQSVARFLMIEMQGGDCKAANRVFNTAILGNTAILLLLTPAILLLALNASTIINVPEGQSFEFTLLFLGVLGSFIMDAWGGSFNVSMFVRNRLDIWGTIQILQRVLQVVFLIALFSIAIPSVSQVGLSYAISSALILGIIVFVWRRLTPQLKVCPWEFDRGRCWNIGCMTSWMIVNQVGTLLFLNIDLILVNILYGSIATAEYSVALQLSVMFRSVATPLYALLLPLTLAYYANNMHGKIVHLSRTAVKLFTLGFVLPIGLLCGFAPEVLTLWIGEELALVAPLLIILTIHLVVNLAFLPLTNINIAFNKMRIPGIITLGLGALTIPLAIIFSYIGWGIYGVALAGVITLTLRNSVFLPWYAARITLVSPYTFLRPIVPGAMSTIVLVITIFWAKQYILVVSWGSLVLISSIMGLLYVMVIWLVGLTTAERELILHLIPLPIRRIVAAMPVLFR
jgi:O-antigen/teichoic acid export membrane protein